MRKNPSNYGRRNSYSGLESESLFKPATQKLKLNYSEEGIATNLDEVITRKSPPLDVSLADEINRKLAKQKEISDTLEEWQKKIRSSSLTNMPILEDNSEDDKNDDQCSKIPCRTLK